MDYRQSIDWLYGTQRFGIKLGLEGAKRLLRALGVDEEAPGCKVVHVAGTNGKGSVCAFAERILRDAGLRTGLFTSPHLVSYRERIRVRGELIPEESVAAGLTAIRELVADWEMHPTFFEISLALAMRHFAARACEALVLETGMGGRLDATTAVAADVAVITSIALDHREWLGESLREIAVEKAGIIRPGRPVIVGDLAPDAREAVGRRALELGAPCIEARPLPENWILGLKGPHQGENASLAVEAACRVAGERLTREGIRESLARTNWPARFQRIAGRDLVIDGAHNPAAAGALRRTWEAEFPGVKACLVFGAVESKDSASFLAALLPAAGSVVLTPVRSPRALPPAALREALVAAGGGDLPCAEAADPAAALDAAARLGGPVLVAGSIFLAGEFLAHLLGGDFEASLQ